MSSQQFVSKHFMDSMHCPLTCSCSDQEHLGWAGSSFENCEPYGVHGWLVSAALIKTNAIFWSQSSKCILNNVSSSFVTLKQLTRDIVGATVEKM